MFQVDKLRGSPSGCICCLFLYRLTSLIFSYSSHSYTVCLCCFSPQNLQQSSRNTSQDPLLNEASLLALPVVVSLINLLLPGLFNLAAWMEEYDSPSIRTYVAIGRYEQGSCRLQVHKELKKVQKN